MSTPSPARWSLPETNVLAFVPPDSLTQGLTDEEIAGGYSLFTAYVQLSDGVNSGRAALCRVINITSDSRPADALPRTWMNDYFKSDQIAAPGADAHPDSDPDKDGLTNRQEYNIGTNPINPGSPGPLLTYDHANSAVTLNPVRYTSFRIQESSDLTNWTTRCLYSPGIATTPTTFTLPTVPAGQTQRFIRAIPVP